MARNGNFHWYIKAETRYCLRETGDGLRGTVPNYIKLQPCFSFVPSVGLFMLRPVSALVQRTATRSSAVWGTEKWNCNCWLNYHYKSEWLLCVQPGLTWKNSTCLCLCSVWISECRAGISLCQGRWFFLRSRAQIVSFWSNASSRPWEFSAAEWGLSFSLLLS